MGSDDDYKEILEVLLADLQNAFAISKAKHAIQATQKAYMKAAQNKRDMERWKQMQTQFSGS